MKLLLAFFEESSQEEALQHCRWILFLIAGNFFIAALLAFLMVQSTWGA